MNISAPFIGRPVATTLLMLALVLVGIAAYPLLPVAPLPRVDFPTIAVTGQFPGASAETMAATVAQPLEYQFAEIPGISQLTSVSVQGTTQVTIQFDLDRNIDAAATDVQAAINAASGQLPKALPSAPTYRKTNPADSPILILALQSDDLPLTAVDDQADNVFSQQISQLAGVSQVVIGGAQKPSIRVQVDPARLAGMGLTLEDVRGALGKHHAGDAEGGGRWAAQEFRDLRQRPADAGVEVDGQVIAYRNGGAIRVRDIGHAVDGPENTKLAGWQNGHRGIQLLIFKQPDANVIDTVERIKAALPRLEAAIPPQIRVLTIVDRTTTIRASVKDVQFTLLLTIALVVMVIFLFLRNAWATIIPSLAVPVALICTFAVMYLSGYSLDNLSLMALTISVGFVVDDAIVVLENIFRHIEDGMEPRAAALKGSGEIGFTIVSISASLVAVFIPLLLMGGIVGRLFREFAMTVTAAVLISMVVSLTLTPMLCAKFLRSPGRPSRASAFVERGFDALLGGYRRTLDVALRFRAVTLGVFFVTVAVTVVAYMDIPKGFFPQQDTGIVIAVTEAAQDASFDEMARIQVRLADVLRADADVGGLSSTIGAGVGGQTQNNGRIYINLKPLGSRTGGSASQFIERLQPKLNAVVGGVVHMQAAQDITIGGRLSRTQYQYTLQDNDGAELTDWTQRILAKMTASPLLRDVATDQQAAGTTATLTVDRDRAAQLGLSLQAINDTLYDAFGQRQVTQYFTQTNSYHLILEVLPELQGRLDTLGLLYVNGANGIAVPLSAVVSVDADRVVPLAISHQGQTPAVTLSFNLAPGVALGQAVDAIRGDVAAMNPPRRLTGTFQGSAQAFQAALGNQPLLILAALVTIYIILGALYESFILPLSILSTLPSAGLGALIMLRGFGYDLSVIALIGIILLIGIVKKNGIMMVDFAIHAERGGAAPADAIRQACLLRFRPILMTTMAALLSGLPLMLGTGTGSELRRPLGFAMVGGLAVSQVLTLYTTPVVYLYLSRLQHALALRPRRKPALAAAMEPADAD